MRPSIALRKQLADAIDAEIADRVQRHQTTIAQLNTTRAAAARRAARQRPSRW